MYLLCVSFTAVAGNLWLRIGKATLHKESQNTLSIPKPDRFNTVGWQIIDTINIRDHGCINYRRPLRTTKGGVVGYHVLVLVMQI